MRTIPGCSHRSIRACWAFLALLVTCLTDVRAQNVLDYLDPSPNNFVHALAIQPDGKILVGGSFTSISGQSRFYIARLDPVTGLPDSNPYLTANGDVRCIVLQPDGKIIVGGSFTSIGGASRKFIARLDPVTGLADAFNPNPDLTVTSIALDKNGKILVGGYFNEIGGPAGQTRNRIARLDPETGMADSFNPNAEGGAVQQIAVQEDGKVLVGGYFDRIGGQARDRIARLDPETGLADAFDPGANNSVQAIALQRDGKILIGGEFTRIGGQNRRSLARLDPTTGFPDEFDPSPGGGVYSIVLQEDDKILVGGYFGFVAGVARHNVARLEPGGRCDLFNPDVNNTVRAIAVQANGKVLVGGGFWTASGQLRNNLARCLGEVSFASPTPIPSPVPLAVNNGKIAFSVADPGTSRQQIYVINPNGTGLTRLTDCTVYWGCESPSWSPDGSKIVYSGWSLNPIVQQDIYIMNADGSNKRRVTDNHETWGNARCPAWSPSGQKIAFAKAPSGSSVFQIHVMDTDGANQVSLTNSSSGNYGPQWSPDGRRIAFTRQSSGASQIYVINFNGTGEKQLTNAPGYNLGPAWSPDGSMMAFSSNRQPSQGYQIYVMNAADGKGPFPVANSIGAQNVVWSPDGTKIAINGILITDLTGLHYLQLGTSGYLTGSSWQRLSASH